MVGVDGEDGLVLSLEYRGSVNTSTCVVPVTRGNSNIDCKKMIVIVIVIVADMYSYKIDNLIKIKRLACQLCPTTSS